MIKKITYLVMLLVTIAFISSCNKKYAFKVKEVDFDNRGEVLNGDIVDINILAMDQVLVCDTLLIITTNDPSSYIRVYNTITKDSIASILREGRARNEAHFPISSSKQFYYVNNDLILPMWDSNDKIIEVNITQSIRTGNTVIGNVRDCDSFTRTRSVILNNDIYNTFDYHKMLPDPVLENGFILPKYKVGHIDNKREIKVFPKMMNFTEPDKQSPMYFGCPFINHEQNIVIQPFQYMNYILFFDLEKSKNFAIHLQDALSFDDQIVYSEYIPLCFCDCAISSDFFILLRQIDNETREAVKKKNVKEILIFNWEGEYLHSAVLGDLVNDIGYDENNMILYGLDRSNEILYSYDLSHIIKELQ